MSGTLAVTPLSPAVGAAVTGVRLDDPIDNEAFAAIERAFYQHCVLVFPGQHLGPADQQAFGERFGEPLVVPYLAAHARPRIPGDPARDQHGQGADPDRELALRLGVLRRAAADRHPGGPAAARLRRRHDVGQPVRRVRGVVASDARRARRHCGRRSPARSSATTGCAATSSRTTRWCGPTRSRDGRRSARADRVSAALRGHDRGGEPAAAEFLYEHCTRPEFVYRHRWGAGRRRDVGQPLHDALRHPRLRRHRRTTRCTASRCSGSRPPDAPSSEASPSDRGEAVRRQTARSVRTGRPARCGGRSPRARRRRARRSPRGRRRSARGRCRTARSTGKFDPSMQRCAPKASTHASIQGRMLVGVQSGSEAPATAEILHTTLGGECEPAHRRRPRQRGRPACRSSGRQAWLSATVTAGHRAATSSSTSNCP